MLSIYIEKADAQDQLARDRVVPKRPPKKVEQAAINGHSLKKAPQDGGGFIVNLIER